ncbi:YSIRK-type signal peptide-containing protein [Streptococcus equi subsp. zooepidemicus]|nr:YSIRK-type signal peptide-containing protein [Streptococcus equi subsp. zooepidemicus]
MNESFVKITFFNKSRRTSSGEKERFSLRKYKSGMVSVLLDPFSDRNRISCG